MKEKIIKLIFCAIICCLLFSFPVYAATVQYTYDNLNRLVQVRYEDGTTIQCTYDAVGNRLVKQVTPPTP